jgi:hypothetical protein
MSETPKEGNKPRLGERLKTMLNEYGPVALYTYLAVFALVLVGFTVSIRTGFQVEGAAAGAGTLAAAYVATKVTQPLRIAATLALTPIVARVLRSRRSRRTPDAASGD